MKIILNNKKLILLLVIIFTVAENRIEAQQNLFRETKVETFGTECNPTGNPIGGLTKYSNVILHKDYVVKNSDELLTALKNDNKGKVICGG